MKTILLSLLLMASLLFSVSADLNWTNYYGGDNSDGFNDGVITSDGNVILCGFKKLDANSWYNLYLMKCNLNGEIIWEQYYEWAEHNEGIAIEATSDGCFVILVESGDGSSDYSPRLVKIDNDGEIVWEVLYGGLDNVKDIIQTDNGQFLVLGSAFGENTWIAKIDGDGNLLWTQEQDTASQLKSATELLNCSNSDEFLVLYTDISQPFTKCGIQKLDSEGEVVWDNVYVLSDNFYPSSINEIDNTYVISGRFHQDAPCLLQKLVESNNGDFIDNFPIEVEISNSFDYLHLPGLGNIYLGHKLESGNNYVLAVTDENNQLNWNADFLDENYYDIPYSILKISNDTFWVIGMSQHESWTDLQGFIAEFQVNITHNEDVVQSADYYLSNYPNPFNPTTTISFQLNTESTEDTELGIFNIKGQKIKSYLIPPSTLSPITTVTWNGTDNQNNPVTSGVYLISLKSGSKTLVQKKCLLLK